MLHSELRVLEEIQQMERELKTLKLEVINEMNREKRQPKNLDIREFSGELKQISYRYDLEVLKAFDKLCAMYPHYTKQKILNTVLMEALEEYL